MQTSSSFVVAASLHVSTEVQCFISVTVGHFQLYIAQERLGFDLDIEVYLSDAPLRISLKHFELQLRAATNLTEMHNKGKAKISSL